MPLARPHSPYYQNLANIAPPRCVLDLLVLFDLEWNITWWAQEKVNQFEVGAGLTDTNYDCQKSSMLDESEHVERWKAKWRMDKITREQNDLTPKTQLRLKLLKTAEMLKSPSSERIFLHGGAAAGKKAIVEQCWGRVRSGPKEVRPCIFCGAAQAARQRFETQHCQPLAPAADTGTAGNPPCTRGGEQPSLI